MQFIPSTILLYDHFFDVIKFYSNFTLIVSIVINFNPLIKIGIA